MITGSGPLALHCTYLSGLPSWEPSPGSVFEKKLTGGLGLFFWVWNFWYSYFFGFGKISLIFLGLKIFHLFFWGSNFDTIYFFGCPVRRIAQIAQRTYFCGFVIFMNLFFWVWFFLVFIFLGVPKNAWAEPPLSFTCQSTLPGEPSWLCRSSILQFYVRVKSSQLIQLKYCILIRNPHINLSFQ